MVPTERIREVSDQIETGDVLAFATAIPGLDVTHAALAYRDGGGVLRVLHAPLSGGVVEVTRATLAEYVAGIRRATGILVARPSHHRSEERRDRGTGRMAGARGRSGTADKSPTRAARGPHEPEPGLSPSRPTA